MLWRQRLTQYHLAVLYFVLECSRTQMVVYLRFVITALVRHQVFGRLLKVGVHVQYEEIEGFIKSNSCCQRQILRATACLLGSRAQHGRSDLRP